MSLEVDFPYVAQDVACKDGLPNESHLASWAYLGSADAAPTTDQIKAAVIQYGLVTTVITAQD